MLNIWSYPQYLIFKSKFENFLLFHLFFLGLLSFILPRSVLSYRKNDWRLIHNMLKRNAGKECSRQNSSLTQLDQGHGGLQILVEPVEVGETATPNSMYSRPINEVWTSQILSKVPAGSLEPLTSGPIVMLQSIKTPKGGFLVAGKRQKHQFKTPKNSKKALYFFRGLKRPKS